MENTVESRQVSGFLRTVVKETETGNHQSMKPEILVWFLNNLCLVWQRIVLAVQQIMTELHFYEFLDMAAVYLVQHPVVALFVLAMTLCCGIPVLMFLVFVVISVIFTFTGFIVIEGLLQSVPITMQDKRQITRSQTIVAYLLLGTILTIGLIVLCGVLLGMIIVILTLAIVVGVAYFGFMEIYGLLQNSPENSPVSRYLSNHLYKQKLQVRPQKNTDEKKHDSHHED